MKVYRVYYKTNILGTFTSQILALQKADEFINAGFMGIHIEIEKMEVK